MADIKNHASLTTNLVSYWDMEENSAGTSAVTRYDLHGSNNLTDNNTCASATGKIGNGADFEDTNSEYLSITDAAQSGLEFSTDFSIFAWVKLESHPNSANFTVLGKWEGTTNRQYLFTLTRTSGGTARLRLVLFSGTASEQVVDTTLNTATWYHVGVTYDLSAGEARFYQDGSQVGSTQTGGKTSIGTGADPVLVGTDGNFSDYFDGVIDELGVWSKILTTDEITDLYNSGSGLPYYLPDDIANDTGLSTSLVSYYELEEATAATTWTDSHGSNDLTNNSSGTGVTSVSGVINNGADFELSDTEALVGSSGSGVPNGSDWSVSFWTTPETIGTAMVPVASQGAGSIGALYVRVETDGKIFTSFADTNETKFRTTNAVLSAATTAHVVITADVDADDINVYIDGVEVANSQLTTAASSFTDGTNWQIGSGASLSSPYDGVIDELALYSKILTLDEVRALYGYGTPPNYEDVAASTFTPKVIMF